MSLEKSQEINRLQNKVADLQKENVTLRSALVANCKHSIINHAPLTFPLTNSGQCATCGVKMVQTWTAVETEEPS